MNKAIGLLLVGLGIIFIAIGVKGNQSQILADLKAINPKLRGTVGVPSTAPAAPFGASGIGSAVAGTANTIGSTGGANAGGNANIPNPSVTAA